VLDAKASEVFRSLANVLFWPIKPHRSRQQSATISNNQQKSAKIGFVE
jgi:hypothetical protein